MKGSRKIHENYHNKTGVSIKIVSKNNFTYRILIDVINRYLKNRAYILDIGCGAGTLSFYVSNLGNKVLGIDISKKAIEECKKSAKKMKLKNVRFIQAEFPNFSFSTKFDTVIFTEVVEHLPDDTSALKKIYSILKKDGLLIISTPSINAPLHKLGLTTRFDAEVGHLRRYELKQFKKLIIISGFKILETKKTEGILRNFLFVNPYAGKFVRFLNFSEFLSDIVTFLDKITLNFFGESNYIIVARKVSKKNKK